MEGPRAATLACLCGGPPECDVGTAAGSPVLPGVSRRPMARDIVEQRRPRPRGAVRTGQDRRASVGTGGCSRVQRVRFSQPKVRWWRPMPTKAQGDRAARGAGRSRGSALGAGLFRSPLRTGCVHPRGLHVCAGRCPAAGPAGCRPPGNGDHRRFSQPPASRSHGLRGTPTRGFCAPPGANRPGENGEPQMRWDRIEAEWSETALEGREVPDRIVA